MSNVMKDLMIHVERIVRPVRADWSKSRMRRELLAHLQAAYEEERTRGKDESAALDDAKRRLGDAAALTAELQASVPRLERLGATPFSRPVALTLLGVCALIPVIVGVALIPAGAAPAPVVGGIAVMALCAVLFYAYTIEFFRSPVRWSRVIPAGIAGVVTQLGWMSLVSLALTARPVPDDLAEAAWALFVVPAFLGVSGGAVILLRRPLRQWLELDIAG